MQAPDIRKFLTAAFLSMAVLLLAAGPSGAAPSFDWQNLAGTPGGYGCADGKGADARFDAPLNAAYDAAGNLFVIDSANGTIRKVSTTGVVTTVAGHPNFRIGTDGSPRKASLRLPTAIAIGPDGIMYVGDAFAVRRVFPDGRILTIAGSLTASGQRDGSGAEATFKGPTGLAVDDVGNIYVADFWNYSIRKITPGGKVSTLAGSQRGVKDGEGTAASFQGPISVSFDHEKQVLYVADSTAYTIRKVTLKGKVTTLAGSPGVGGSTDGKENARFRNPGSAVPDGRGNLYVADLGNAIIRRIDADGVVTTIAGQAGKKGILDGAGTAARFNAPAHLAVDKGGNLAVIDSGAHTVRRVTPDGVVTTLAGLPPHPGSTDAVKEAGADSARFFFPRGIALRADGTAYLTTLGSRNLRVISPAQVVSTLQLTSTDPELLSSDPAGITVDPAGTIFVTTANQVLKISSTGAATLLAGGNFDSEDGMGAQAGFQDPEGLVADAAGVLYVADTGNHLIRRIAADGTVTTVAGTAGDAGNRDGVGLAAKFHRPSGIAISAKGELFVTDSINHEIRKIAVDGTVSTLAGLKAAIGIMDGTGRHARLQYPFGITLGKKDGAFYFTDGSANPTLNDSAYGPYAATIRRITLEGVVTTVGGRAGRTGSLVGIGKAALFCQPTGLVTDSAGNIYVADGGNYRIAIGSKITPTPTPSPTP